MDIGKSQLQILIKHILKRILILKYLLPISQY